MRNPSPGFQLECPGHDENRNGVPDYVLDRPPFRCKIVVNFITSSSFGLVE